MWKYASFCPKHHFGGTSSNVLLPPANHMSPHLTLPCLTSFYFTELRVFPVRRDSFGLFQVIHALFTVFAPQLSLRFTSVPATHCCWFLMRFWSSCSSALSTTSQESGHALVFVVRAHISVADRFPNFAMYSRRPLLWNQIL